MSDGSAVLLVIRMIVSLAVVLAILVVLGRIMHRRYGGQLRKSRGLSASIEVLARQSLSRSASVHVVRVGQETLLLGVTDQGVAVLAQGDRLEQPDAELPALADPPALPRIPGRRWLTRLAPGATHPQPIPDDPDPAETASATSASRAVRPAGAAATASPSAPPSGGLLGQLRGRAHDPRPADSHEPARRASKQQDSLPPRRNTTEPAASVVASVQGAPTDFDGRVEARLSQAQVIQFAQAEPPARTLLERAYIEARLPVTGPKAGAAQSDQDGSGRPRPGTGSPDRVADEPVATPGSTSTAMLRTAEDQSDAMTQVVARVLKRQDRRRG